MGDIGRSIILSIVLFACASARAADAVAQDEILPASTQAENGKQQGNQKSDSDIQSSISTYKIHYFALNNLPNNDNAQVKFQLNVKYKLFNREISVGGHPLALYLAYSQISLWNVGQSSKPFEESNYNPETFLNYSANITRGSVALRDIADLNARPIFK